MEETPFRPFRIKNLFFILFRSSKKEKSILWLLKYYLYICTNGYEW